MPLRKSLRWKAASASRRSAAVGFVAWPASALICASSLIAASARSSRLNGLSAAKVGADNSRTSAAAQAARTNASMGDLRFPSGGGSSERGDGKMIAKTCRGRGQVPRRGATTSLESSSATADNYMIGLDFRLTAAPGSKALRELDWSIRPTPAKWVRLSADLRRSTARHKGGDA